ncbi:MAG TPA: hypothetical protein VG013_37235 [Gemmataceae bacterium]|nr:hypothetical protein [Gemmataceae bacterium]
MKGVLCIFPLVQHPLAHIQHHRPVPLNQGGKRRRILLAEE